MKIRLFIFLFLLSLLASAQKTDLLIIGSDHFAQIYNPGNPATDILTPQRQKEVHEFNRLVLRYQPDVIMVERLPEEQGRIDSLYALYRAGNLPLQTLDDGRSEVFQIAFPIAKQLGLKSIRCVNAPGGTSQGILDNGENIDLYRKEGLELRAMVSEKMKALGENKLSFRDYLLFLNQPSTYNKVYKLRYITPARVINGTFRNPDAAVDTAFVNPKYIGAEIISVFKNRDYKIYSNIVTTQMKTDGKRILLLIGAAHIGSLNGIFRDDESYRLIESKQYLKK